MPQRPGLPCAVPRCGQLQPCSRHPKRYFSDRARGSQSERGLGSRQAKWRLVILANDPMCRGCEVAPATDADHIVPRRPGAEDWSEANGQGLCQRCHSYKTAVEQRDPFFGLRLREEGAKLGQRTPMGWRDLKLFGGTQ
jgi:5-methylcytosine-specific restriction endonuclease McrA